MGLVGSVIGPHFCIIVCRLSLGFEDFDKCFKQPEMAKDTARKACKEALEHRSHVVDACLDVKWEVW